MSDFNYSRIRQLHVVNSENLAEHRRREAVRNEVEALLKSRAKSAGPKLVQLLHGAEDGLRAMDALTTGLVNNRDKTGAGPCLTLAEMCFYRKRPDILRAVYEAGPPQWLKDIPRLDADPTDSPDAQFELQGIQFNQLGFRLPELRTQRDWMRVLTSYQGSYDSELHEASLYMVASWPLLDHSADFLALAHEDNPEHHDIPFLAASRPGAHAMLMEIIMRRQLEASPAPAESSEPAPRRRRASL